MSEPNHTPIEDYALLGDLHSAALVSRAGDIDWLTFPRFDSAACFAALLGTGEHGRWSLRPAEVRSSTRRYREDTMVLETRHETADGVVEVVDAMTFGTSHRVLRLVRGVEGRVRMRTELRVRFDYGSVVPWVRSRDDGLHAVAGPDALRLTTSVDLRPADHATVADFEVGPGDEVGFDLLWFPSHEDPDPPADVAAEIERTTAGWREWMGGCSYDGAYRNDVRASLTVLKALTYEPTGGIVAAPTTSLPETLGGCRNWDYRYCWLRDATFTLIALTDAGFRDEARSWREWLVRAVAGNPDDLQVLYGLRGERRIPEAELDWLPGYAGSAPVRIGNGAVDQIQLDVYGELFDALHAAREGGLEPDDDAWGVQRHLMGWLEEHWREPDHGIWEVRGERRHFTHSKIMAWVAADRAVYAVEQVGLDGDAERWRALRDEIKADVMANAVDERGVLVQSYGSEHLDAAVLMAVLTGFLDLDDPVATATVDAVAEELCEDGLLLRYRTDSGVDGLPGEEGTFLLCSFWLVDALWLMGRNDEAEALFERLLDLRNDVGLLAEEYAPRLGRQVGNYPQAFSHIALVTTAMTLCTTVEGVSQRRAAC